MEILSQSFGLYGTNCYILKSKIGEIIIDAGEGSAQWVVKNVTHPLAIFCTHGHFDHIYDVARLQNELCVRVFIHKDDAFMTKDDPFRYGAPPFQADVLVDDERVMRLDGRGEILDDICKDEFKNDCVSFKFHHFAGHTPGCCMIEIVGEEIMFSGDFLFKDSIGRCNFPYSSRSDMIKSLQKCKLLKGDFTLYAGHGESSSLRAEQANLDEWIKILS